MGAIHEEPYPFSHAGRFRTQLLFVETRRQQLVLDGLAEPIDSRSERVSSPFALELRRPQSSLVEWLLLDLFQVYCDEERLLDIDLAEDGTVGFHTVVGVFHLALEAVTGLPSAP